MGLAGKVAIVTGAGRGLGRDYAKFLSTEGAQVVVADVNADDAKATTADLEAGGGEALAVAVAVPVQQPQCREELVLTALQLQRHRRALFHLGEQVVQLRRALCFYGRAPKGGPNPFIDSPGYKAEIDLMEAMFQAVLTSQQGK